MKSGHHQPVRTWRGAARLLVFCAALILVLPAWAAPRTVKVGLHELGPLIHRGDAGAEGLFPDILKAVAGVEDWTLEYVAGSWTEVLEMFRKGEIDLVPAMAWSEARGLWVDFSTDPIFTDAGLLYVPRQSGITTVFDLQGKRVAVLADSVTTSGFRDFVLQSRVNPVIMEMESNEASFVAVAEGRADAAVCTILAGNGLSLAYGLGKTGISFAPSTFSFAVRKGTNPELLEGINKTVARLKADPESAYYRALGKWTDQLARDWIPAWIWYLAGGAVLLLTVILAGMVLAGNQVKKKTRELEYALKDLAAAQAYARVGSWVWDIPTGNLEWSREMYRIFGVPASTIALYLPRIMMTRIHPDDLAAVEASNRSVMEKGIPVPVEYRVVLPDGQTRTVWAEAGILERDRDGKPSRLSGYVQDITERKAQEALLARHAAERETLLKELYHRTKNNMFVISALLTLEAEEAHYPETADACLGMVTRIHAMSLVHQMIYESDSLSWIDLAEYFPAVLGHSVRSASLEDRPLGIQTSISHTRLSVDQAIPLGLAVNEAVMDACKYCLSGTVHEGTPELRVSLVESAGQLDCVVKVSGAPGGQTAGDDPFVPKGLELIRILVENQLRGTVSFSQEAGGGIQFRMNIPKERRPRA